jgi:hypothetical protein
MSDFLLAERPRLFHDKGMSATQANEIVLPLPKSPKLEKAFRCLVLALFLGSGWLTASKAGSAADKPASEPIVFEKNLAPILEVKCWQCHGSEKQKAGLDLRTRAGLLKGGESGAAVSPGSAEKSVLWEKISTDQMPPGKVKLTSAEKAIFRAWIEGGTQAANVATMPVIEDMTDRQVTDADRQFWAFQPPKRPQVPAVTNSNRVRNSIDAYIVASLEKKGLALSPEADRLTLLRRAFFDLIGLPPSPGDIEEFRADRSTDAYERLIDRLLASPHYGERWGRHWLDLAGYADSEGILDADYVRTAAWRYRDYVIQAFNKDKPYDRFLQEQLAGDELVQYWKAYTNQKALSPEVVEALVATGYLRCGSDTSRPDFVNIKNAPGYYYQTLDDTMKIVASSTLGLTLECAKCHSHKYDPIPQRDYYRLQAVFMSAYRPGQWVPQAQRRILEASAVQEKEAQVKHDAAIGELQKKADALKNEFARFLFTGRLGKLPEAIREDVRQAISTEPAKRNEVQKYLAAKFEKDLRPEAKDLERILATEFVTYKARMKGIDEAVKAEKAKGISLPEIRALYDLPGEVKTPILRRGDYLQPGAEVQPGALSALAAPIAYSWTPPAKDAKTSGRRLAFAQWLTQPNHPLTARVLVNRQWLYHFGEGIVATPDNFGRTGAFPSHPELLDWLATELVARGWSIKAMHRLIMTSSTYRQTSTFDPRIHEIAKKVDPDNRLLWRQRLKRLDAEALRDAILTASGTANPQMYGVPVPMMRQNDGEVTAPADASGQRRSVYLQVRRSQPLTLLQVFDQPVMETNCARRGVSTVASQALTLLNSDFLMRQADALATRIMGEKPSDPAGHAILVAFGRPATTSEQTRLAAFLKSQNSRHMLTLASGQASSPGQQETAQRLALVDLAHMLLSSNEFAYID